LAHLQAFETPLFQPFFAGIEIRVDAWLTRTHQVKGLALRQRAIIVLNGESAVTSTFRNDVLEDCDTRLRESLLLRRLVVLQLMMDAAECPHAIEVNARFGGASKIAVAAGLAVWYWRPLVRRWITIHSGGLLVKFTRYGFLAIYISMIPIFDLDDTLYDELTYVRSSFRAVAVWGEANLGLDADVSYARLLEILAAEGRGQSFNRWLDGQGT